MTCRPGTLLRLGGVEIASAGGVMLDGDHAHVLTAGHACAGRIGQPVEFFEDDEWHDLGHVEKYLYQGTYDAGVIVSRRSLCDRRPRGMAEELASYSYAQLNELVNLECRVVLGQTNFKAVGRITRADADFSLQFTLGHDQPASTTGDSGSPLIVKKDGERLLAGILIERADGSRVIRFIHPTPALNAMKVPIP
jgi:hypothetical protein